MFLKVKYDNDQKAEACIQQIKLDKEEKLKEIKMLFDEHIRVVSEQNAQANVNIDKSLKSLSEIDASIKKIEGSEKNGVSTMTMILAIKDIQQQAQTILEPML